MFLQDDARSCLIDNGFGAAGGASGGAEVFLGGGGGVVFVDEEDGEVFGEGFGEFLGEAADFFGGGSFGSVHAGGEADDEGGDLAIGDDFGDAVQGVGGVLDMDGFEGVGEEVEVV